MVRLKEVLNHPKLPACHKLENGADALFRVRNRCFLWFFLQFLEIAKTASAFEQAALIIDNSQDFAPARAIAEQPDFNTVEG